MKKFLSAVILLLLFALQTSVMSPSVIFGIEINLVLVYTFAYAVNSDLFASAVMGALCGMLLDVSGGSVIGYNILIVMYLSALTSVVSFRFYSENRMVSVVIVTLSVFVCEFLRLVIYGTLFTDIEIMYTVIRYILPQAVLNAVVCVPVMMCVKWLKNEYIRGI